jgi:hypothetical protein
MSLPPPSRSALLEFLYTGDVREATLHGGIICEVLFNSSKFCLPGLLNICECVLKEMVSTSNVEQVYVAARDSSAAQLVQYVQTEHLYNIQCSEILTLRYEKLHTEA